MADEDERQPKRLVRHTACFTPLENALFMTKVDLAGVSISAFLKSSALDFPLPRAARRPTVNHQIAVQLLSEIGQLTTTFHDATERAHGIDPQAIERAIRDQSEMRIVLLESMGLTP